jgi:hypothetical protein
MSWMKSISEGWDDLTGMSGRRIKALRHASDWAQKLAGFITDFGIQDGTNIEGILDKGGDFRFELTSLIYSGRVLTGESGSLKNKQIARLIEEIVETLESIRRYLFTPALQINRLLKAIAILPLAVAQLQKDLAGILGE